MSAEVAQSLIDVDDGSYTEMNRVPLEDVHCPHDGEKVFARVMEWVKEP
jgi:hypothetical protein